MKSFFNIFGGTSKDIVSTLPPPERRPLPPPVMPCPPPAPRLEGPPSGSCKDGSLEEQMRKAARQARPIIPPETLLAGLAALAESTAKTLGIELRKPYEEKVSRGVGVRGFEVFLGCRYFGDVTAKLLLDCATETATELITPQERAALNKLDEQWNEAHKKLDEVAPTSDRIHFLIAEDAKNAGTPAYRGLDADGFRQRAVEEMRPAKLRLKEITAECAIIATAIHPRVLAALAKQIGQLLEGELKAAAKHSMPFAPSIYLATLDKARSTVAALDISAPFECSPRLFILGLTGLLLDSEAAKK